MSDYRKISVLVPTDRIDDFYIQFASWVSPQPPVPGTAAADAVLEAVDLEPWLGGDDAADERAAAEAIWKKLSPRAKAMFRLLSETPGERHSALEIAQRLNIPNGMYGVAGVLAWPARHAQAEGFDLPISFDAGEAGEGANYWMAPEVAESFVPVMES